MSKYLFIIILFLAACKSDRKQSPIRTKGGESIIGKWKVINSNFSPFEHISFCEKLDIGSIFEFDKNGSIKVYQNENDKMNCNQTQSFWVDSSGLNIFEYDFSFKYELLKLNKDSLIIKTYEVPKYFFKKLVEQGKTENDTTREIQKNGIIIKLSKLNNGG